ncbi:MAG TPA: anthrone oxygenase family protein [Thermoanaerobaculia bacterium]|nr:anthrone oxygenase family protein [Thermoanaerobaculia bacterium]
MLVRSWRFVTILLVALLLGLAFAHVLERPAKMQYDAELYVTWQKTLYVAWGPPNVGGFLEPAAILATLWLAFLVRRRRPAFWLTLGAGAALLLAFPVVFFLFVAPANEAFRSASAASVPANWMEMRSSWETGHAIRFVLQLAALSLLTLSVLLEIREAGTER